MEYILVFTLVLFYVAQVYMDVRKNMGRKGLKRSLLIAGGNLLFVLLIFWVFLFFDALPFVAYPITAVVSLGVLFVVGYVRGRSNDTDIVLFTLFGFSILEMFRNIKGQSCIAWLALGLFVIILAICLYFFMLVKRK